MRVQEYARLLMENHQVVNLAKYFPTSSRGPLLLGSSSAKEQDCGCLYAFMPPIGNVPPGPVVIMCDKHELGALLAEERVRLEAAWKARGP